MKSAKSIMLSVVFSFSLVAFSQTAPPAFAQTPKLAVSTVIEDLQNAKKRDGRITGRELASVGNRLLARKGFNYSFDVCEFLNENARKLSKSKPGYVEPALFSARLTKADGKQQNFRFVSGEGDAPCGECFAPLAAFQVTEKEMILRADGKPVRLRRPKDFSLDEAALVDESLKKTIRRWETPTQTVPLGVSADGTKLYLDVRYFDELNELVLESSENGTLQFRARDELDLKSGERLENFPKEAGNDYLSFVRFRQNGKTYIIKFSMPCS